MRACAYPAAGEGALKPWGGEIQPYADDNVLSWLGGVCMCVCVCVCVCVRERERERERVRVRE